MPSDVKATTHKEKKMPKVLESVEMRKGKTGGHVLTHRFTSYDHAPETHVFGANEGHKLVAHLQQHMGLDTEAAAGTEENEAAKEGSQL